MAVGDAVTWLVLCVLEDRREGSERGLVCELKQVCEHGQVWRGQVCKCVSTGRCVSVSGGQVCEFGQVCECGQV